MSDFTILTVCTGNICRSPLAEMLLRQALRGLPVVVHSAGTHALDGYQMPQRQLAIAASLGVSNCDVHQDKTITGQHVEEADVILPMGREYGSAVVQLSSSSLRRVVTLR